MKKSRFSDKQIVSFLRQAEAGIGIPELCRSGGFSQATFYKWMPEWVGLATEHWPSKWKSPPTPNELKPPSGFRWRKKACIRVALLVTLTLAASHPGNSWARAPQFDSAALLTPQPTSFAQCPQFFANGRPPALSPLPQLRELCYEAFAVLHSGTTRTPVFVAQRLNRQSIEDADEKRAKRFFADARLPSGERAELEDYKNSGYSRGHMAPAGDMTTPTAMAQSFSLANVVPQNAQHNGGAWAKIEQDTRRYVRRAKGDVFIITGPVFADDAPQIGANRVRVPAYLYKLVYDASTQRAWAHWQQNREGETVSRPISYSELVKRTGVELLPGIPVQH